MSDEPKAEHRLPGRRIAVVGSTGSGKTTLARELAHRFGSPHVEFDALHWEPNWTQAAVDVFRGRVGEALSGDAWVADGNYGAVRDITWSRADTIVWLDYRLSIILSRLIRRTLRRVTTGEELWNGNRERWAHQFTRDSLLLWALQTYHRRRRDYTRYLQQPEYAHLTVIHLRSPSETRRWLSSIGSLSLTLDSRR